MLPVKQGSDYTNSLLAIILDFVSGFDVSVFATALAIDNFSLMSGKS